MAILRGFPPSNTISPSVRITEKDLSFIAPEQSFHRAGLVGFASKGPIDMPTLVSTYRQLITTFGYPHPENSDPYLIYAAAQYLFVANELFVVRVAESELVSDERATIAEVDVEASGGLIDILGNVSSPFTFSTDQFFRWRLNDTLSSKTLVILAGTYSASEIVEELNDQLVPQLDGIEFYLGDTGGSVDNAVGVKTTWAHGPNASFEFVSSQDALYGPSSPIGWGTSMTVASTTAANDKYPTGSLSLVGDYDFAGLSELVLEVVVDGTGNVNIDNVLQTIDLSDIILDNQTITDIVNEINGQITAGTIPGGFEAEATGDNLTIKTLHAGRDAKLLVKSTSSAGSILGFDGVTAIGTSPSGATNDISVNTYGIVAGSENSTGLVSMTLTADSAGQDGNSTQVVVTNELSENSFQIDVYNDGVQVEVWGNLTKDQTSSYYVETFLATVSDWIRSEDNVSVTAPPANGTYTLSGGSDGIPSDPDRQDELLLGSPLDYSGMYGFSEPEQIDIDILACPGHTGTTIVLGLLDVLENYRADSMAIIDPPFGLTVKEIVAWQNGLHPLNTTRFDSDFAALYWPWLKIRDNENRIDVWVPPSGTVMAVYAQNDQLAAPWYAPAGVNRGTTNNVLDVYSRPTLAERDQMYGNRNAINPIVQFNDVEGFIVWGQKTLQRRPTALDRVNVRRLMFVIEKRIRSESKRLLFEPHDEIFREQFVLIASRILEDVQTQRGLYDFIIKADEELNTPDVIDRNEFRARIGVQPVKAVEFMFIEFSIHRTGSFSENADTF